jgi:hypothetical protein
MARSAPVQVPGAESAEPAQPTSNPADPKDALIAELQAKLANQEAAGKLPQVVYEPVTPKGREAMAASAVSGMKVAAVRAAIQAGDLDPPVTSYLCSDGYYARNDSDIPKAK